MTTVISKESECELYCVKEVAIYRIKIKRPLMARPDKEPSSDNISQHKAKLIYLLFYRGSQSLPTKICD